MHRLNCLEGLARREHRIGLRLEPAAQGLKSGNSCLGCPQPRGMSVSCDCTREEPARFRW